MHSPRPEQLGLQHTVCEEMQMKLSAAALRKNEDTRQRATQWYQARTIETQSRIYIMGN